MIKVPWHRVEDLVKDVNPTLCRLINEISPADDLPLLLADYYYGDYIFKAGKLVLNQENKTQQPLIDEASFPLGVVINRGLELFIDDHQQITPINTYSAGQCIGFVGQNYINEQNAPYLHLTAGARTTFLLPNISDIVHHRKLMNIYKAPSAPKSLYDHWSIFRKIANYRFQNRFWQAQVLFFTRPWLQRLAGETSVAWLRLKEYLLQQTLQNNKPLCSLMNVRLLKNKLIHTFSSHHLPISQYAINAVCQVKAMQEGELLGFQVASGDEQFMPEHLIQQAYLEDYRLKRYLPVIMHPAKWTAEKHDFPMYYSLNFPTSLLQPCVEMKNLRRTELLQQMRHALQLLDNEHIDYQFMHQQQDDLAAVCTVGEVLGADPYLQKLQRKYPQAKIANSSRFAKGCVCVKSRAGAALSAMPSTKIIELAD